MTTSHGELTYCPVCGHEVYPASEPCGFCGYAGEEVSTRENPEIHLYRDHFGPGKYSYKMLFEYYDEVLGAIENIVKCPICEKIWILKFDCTFEVMFSSDKRKMADQFFFENDKKEELLVHICECGFPLQITAMPSSERIDFSPKNLYCCFINRLWN